MLEKMKKSLSNLGALAAAYLPAGFKDVLLGMAGKIDALEARLDKLENESEK
jgi:hypothetical protein